MNHEGIGLGLTIVKQIVNKNGGMFGVESDGPGHGSTFIITLKMQVADQVPLSPIESESESRTEPTKLHFIEEEMKEEQNLYDLVLPEASMTPIVYHREERQPDIHELYPIFHSSEIDQQEEDRRSPSPKIAVKKMINSRETELVSRSEVELFSLTKPLPQADDSRAQTMNIEQLRGVHLPESPDVKRKTSMQISHSDEFEGPSDSSDKRVSRENSLEESDSIKVSS